MKTIMAVGAHTGDAQLTSGLLLARHAQEGDRIVTLDLTASAARPRASRRRASASTTSNARGSSRRCSAARASCWTFRTAS